MPRKAKAIMDIRSEARKYTATAIKTLHHIACQPDAPPSARVAAAQCLLDRGWGKPKETVEVQGQVDHRLHKPDLDELLSQMRQSEQHNLIDVTPDSANTLEHNEYKQ